LSSKEDKAAYQRAWYQRNADKVRGWVNRYRAANIEKIQAYDRARGYRGKKPQQKAHNAARNIKAEVCMYCGSTEKIEKHHPDYTQPRWIVPLCRRCHRTLHRKF